MVSLVIVLFLELEYQRPFKDLSCVKIKSVLLKIVCNYGRPIFLFRGCNQNPVKHLRLDFFRKQLRIKRLFPTKTPRGFYVETTWTRPFPRRFNVESSCCVYRVTIFEKNPILDVWLVSEYSSIVFFLSTVSNKKQTRK